MALLAPTVRELPAILREDVHSAEFYTSAEVPGFYQKIFGASNQLTADLVTGLAAHSYIFHRRRASSCPACRTTA